MQYFILFFTLNYSLFSYFSFTCSHCVFFFFPSGMSRALCTRKTNWRKAGPRKSVATLQRLRLVVAGGGASQPIALSSYGISSWIQRCITPRKTKETKLRAIKQMSPRESERFARVPTVVNHGRNARATIAKKKHRIKTNWLRRWISSNTSVLGFLTWTGIQSIGPDKPLQRLKEALTRLQILDRVLISKHHGAKITIRNERNTTNRTTLILFACAGNTKAHVIWQSKFHMMMLG